MSEINDGGPAFPRSRPSGYINTKDPDWEFWERQASGMTLRDWFAGQALTGILVDSRSTRMTVGEATSTAFELADSMLRAREKKP